MGRSVFIVNLDPAADTFAYECTAGSYHHSSKQKNIFSYEDIRELISVDDVLEDKEMAMGPNGALIFCMEYLAKNLEWLQEQVDEGEDAYFLFDCPGPHPLSAANIRWV
jgi:GPN-loop GTPase